LIGLFVRKTDKILHGHNPPKKNPDTRLNSLPGWSTTLTVGLAHLFTLAAILEGFEAEFYIQARCHSCHSNNRVTNSQHWRLIDWSL